MIWLKTAPVFLLALLVGAEKKIELQDIEEDNLKSEKDSDNDVNEPRAQSHGETGLLPLEFLKSGLFHYFGTPPSQPQPTAQPRYVQQYDVTEQPEQPPPVAPKPQHVPTGAQQAMVGYYSNVPMQILLVPQYYNEAPEQSASPQSSVQSVQYSHTAPSGPSSSVSGRGYPTAPETQQQTNYVEVPAYVTPSGKAYIQPYPYPQHAMAFVTYAPQPTAPSSSQAAVSPMVAYQMPVVHYQTAIAAPPVAPKGYYRQYTETNSVDDTQDAQSPKQYATHTEVPYSKATQPDLPRYYNTRHPYRDDPRYSPISELPPPNPILFKNPPPHLSHLAKALPMVRPLTKPVYTTGGGFIANAYLPRPNEPYAIPLRRKPNSLLDSYIPSSLQIEYMKRGHTKDPLQAYEALASGRHFPSPRHFERGFLPNQIYHTAAGGITFGHYKRTPKLEHFPKNSTNKKR